MSARSMAEQFAALVKLADETFRNSETEKLVNAVLDFAEEHVMVARQFADGTMVEALVPFASPLRDIDSATGRPSWAVVPSSLVRALQRAIPLLVALGDHTGNAGNRCEVLEGAHDALSAIGADVPNGYPPSSDNDTGTGGGNPRLAELITAVEAVQARGGIVGLPNREELRLTLARYEATGDHNHGRGPIKPGAPCPGGDCYVDKARKLLGMVGGES